MSALLTLSGIVVLLASIVVGVYFAQNVDPGWPIYIQSAFGVIYGFSLIALGAILERIEEVQKSLRKIEKQTREEDDA